MENQKNNPSKLMVYHVDVDLKSLLDRYERIIKSNKRLTFALFACASYILIKNQVANRAAKAVKEATEKAKDQLEEEFKKGE